jgi:hypothetical protein
MIVFATARPIVDFGLVVLIWLVQLIIYPGFAYLSEAQMAVWHPRYTNLIAVIVGPLMLAQVVCVGWPLTTVSGRADRSVWLSAALVAFVWWSTATQAIPLHEHIDAGTDLPRTVARLVAVNWPRTVAWTLIFSLNWFR